MSKWGHFFLKGDLMIVETVMWDQNFLTLPAPFLCHTWMTQVNNNKIEWTYRMQTRDSTLSFLRVRLWLQRARLHEATQPDFQAEEVD